MNKRTTLTLADSICDLRSRKIKKTFFTQINAILDWFAISVVMGKYYTKGKSATGKPAYDGLLLFKACLLQTWYGLSDYEVEDKINDSLSFSYFCGMSEHFGSIRRWFSGAIARYRGIENMHTQNLMEAIGYNLYRSPGIIVSNSVKNSK